MISGLEKQQILSLMQSPQWGAIERVAHELCDTIKFEPVVGNSEWETLKAALMADGQITGIKRLLQELDRLARQ